MLTNIFIMLFFNESIRITCTRDFQNHGYEPQGNPWTLIPQQAAEYYTLRCAGLFDLQISIHFVFEI